MSRRGLNRSPRALSRKYRPMKKSSLALLLLGAVFFLTFFTMPRLRDPVLTIGKGRLQNSKEKPPGGVLPEPLNAFTSRLVQSHPQIKPLTAQIWHDAMASDVPREIGEYASPQTPNISGTPVWSFLGQGGAEKNKGPSAFLSQYSPYSVKNSKNLGSNPIGFSRISSAKASTTQFKGKPNREIEAEKHLLKEWVKTGKVPGKARRHENKKIDAGHKPAQKHSRASHAPRNPLLAAYHLAQIHVHRASHQLRESKRRRAIKRNHKKHSKRKPSFRNLIGKKSLTSPRAGKFPPNPWNQGNPPPLPEGQYFAGRALEPNEIASLSLPSSQEIPRRNGWFTDGRNYYYHQGPKLGILSNGGWAWIVMRGKKSFVYVSPEAQPLILSQNHLWTQEGGEFLLEENGRALGKNKLLVWKDSHPEDPHPTIRYSANLSKMAITSQKKTTVYSLSAGN